MDRNNFDRAYLAIQQFLKGWMEEVLEEHYSQVQMEFSTPTFDLGPSVRKEVWALCKYLSLHKNGIPALACDILQMYLSIYLKQRKDLTPGSDRWNAAVSFINNRSSLFISIGVAIAAKIDDAGNFTSFDTVIPFFPDMVIYTKKDIAIIQWEILRTTGRQIPSWDTVDIALLIATMLELPNEWNHIITYTMDIAEYNRSQIGTDLQIASVGLFYGAQKLWRLHLAAAAVLVTIRRHCIMYKHLLNRISRLTETSEIRIMRISDLIIKHFNKRPDINVLLVGDPSVAKSQLLCYVLQTAPRAITNTGRGSSGVGLTAAVTTDSETKDRRLEAGAMVLADRVVCIDEFDKMSDVDRTAIHEVMEQGKVTITKAGMHASLNARCSVLAAANPVYGRYDQYKTPIENIGLQDSLLSRFDLLFVMLDIADPVEDDTIAEHVLRMHTYRHPQEKDGEVLPSSSGQRLSTKNPDHDEDEDISKTMYEKYDPLLYGGTRSNTDKILSTTFMRKFIRIGRLLKPKLTQQASDILAEEYVRLRSQDYHTTDTDVARTQPVTARTLETLIRLSTAHAKCRMSGQLTKEDAMVAIKLVQYAYFKKVLTKEKRRAPDDGEQPSTSKAKKAKGKKEPEVKDTGTSDNEAEVLVQAAHTREPESSERPSTSSETTIEANRLNQFKLALNELFKSEWANSLPLGRVSNYVNEEYAHAPFTSGEINAAIHTMVQANQVMFADDIIFLI